MTCIECNKELSYLDHRQAMDLFKVELCPAHRKRMEQLIRRQHSSAEAITLYYGLIQAGVKPMLAWWDGKKTVDLAISRVKLNIEIDAGFESITCEQALSELEYKCSVHQDEFTTIRIPRVIIRNNLKDTVETIMGITEGLRNNLKVI